MVKMRSTDCRKLGMLSVMEMLTHTNTHAHTRHRVQDLLQIFEK